MNFHDKQLAMGSIGMRDSNDIKSLLAMKNSIAKTDEQWSANENSDGLKRQMTCPNQQYVKQVGKAMNIYLRKPNVFVIIRDGTDSCENTGNNCSLMI